MASLEVEIRDSRSAGGCGASGVGQAGGKGGKVRDRDGAPLAYRKGGEEPCVAVTGCSIVTQARASE